LSPALLELDSLSVSYGPARVLFDISMVVPEGATVAVLGANGAGKSTLGKAVAGLVPLSGGMRLEGRDVAGSRAEEVARAGVAYLPQERGIFPGLSVEDNLALFARLGPRRERHRFLERALERFPVLEDRRRQRASTLSGGEQQMLALCRVLVHRPRLIVADEPGMGLAPLMAQAVFAALGEARAEGTALLLIDQFPERALGLADSCVVLTRGRLAWQGPAAAAPTHLASAYLGSAS
jgi:branched-chain amino acid transport system ATP-binding protein